VVILAIASPKGASPVAHSNPVARRFTALVPILILALLVAACGSASSSGPGWTFGPVVGASQGASSGPTIAATEQPTATPAATLGFTPGTASAPRIVELTADDFLNFTPGVVQAAVGETVKFKIHNVGKATHEFMVGLLADAFADKEGTPEVADIGPNQTGEITFTFDGAGPFAFACHAPSHFEHGMAGYIQLVGPGAPTVGTKDNPRVVWLNMDDTLKFMPDSIPVAKGESIRFVLTNSGTVVHEFQVGPADKVAADEVDGVIVVEKDELDAGSTHAVDYTFNGAGPYAYACHEPGHYEAGMKGVVVLG
jgi:uncharacterized cupredoxin-like copper-binding protein